MNHSFIYYFLLLLLVVSCETTKGDGSTMDDTLQTTIEQEMDAWSHRDSSILRAYCLCLENGAVRAEYSTYNQEKEDIIVGSKVIPGDILTPVIQAIVVDSCLTDASSVSHSIHHQEFYDLLSRIAEVFPESDCLIPANLSLPSEWDRALQLTLQGRCHRVSESDICAAYDCVANNGSSYAPFRDYGTNKDKRVVCSVEAATEVIRSIEDTTGRYLPPRCVVYGNIEENGLVREIAVFFSISKKPMTTLLSIAYNRTPAILNQPSNEIMSLINVINSLVSFCQGLDSY